MKLTTVTRTRFGQPEQVQKVECSHDEFKQLVKCREDISNAIARASAYLVVIGAEDLAYQLCDAMHDVILSDFEDDEDDEFNRDRSTNSNLSIFFKGN